MSVRYDEPYLLDPYRAVDGATTVTTPLVVTVVAAHDWHVTATCKTWHRNANSSHSGRSSSRGAQHDRRTA
jgi:hypothetical protein